jgi:aspartyl-tRNA(Asn)/glutamyl-tRNA(Gln) amidotransferase subunit A
MLQVIAGYDGAEPTSARFPTSDYDTALDRRTAAVRIGVPRGFFFENLDPEVDAAAATALSVLQQITAGITDVVLPSKPEGQESVRSAVRSAEAYAYHFEAANKTPELYQSETLAWIRSGSEITTRTYIQARRDLAQAKRVFERAFESVDVLVTPTIPAPPPTTAEMSKDRESSTRLGGIYIRNTAPFDVWGNPTITVPCGFTRKGMPLGLQITGPNGNEALVLQLARAYEKATEWHTRLPEVEPKSS